MFCENVLISYHLNCSWSKNWAIFYFNTLLHLSANQFLSQYLDPVSSISWTELAYMKSLLYKARILQSSKEETCTHRPSKLGLPKMYNHCKTEDVGSLASKILLSSCPYILLLVPKTCGFVWHKSDILIVLRILPTIFEQVWYKFFWTLLRYTVQERMMMSLLLWRKEEEPILPVVKAESPTCTINSTSGGVVASVWVEAWVEVATKQLRRGLLVR